MLRMESANQEIDGRPLPPLGEDARPKFRKGFGKSIIPPSILMICVLTECYRAAQGVGRGEFGLVQGKMALVDTPKCCHIPMNDC